MQISRLLKVGATGAAFAVLVAGCGSSGGDAKPAASPYAGPVGNGEGTLNVLAWPGYAEDGSTDPAVDWVTPFEKETGATTKIVTAYSADAFAQVRRDARVIALTGGRDFNTTPELAQSYVDLLRARGVEAHFRMLPQADHDAAARSPEIQAAIGQLIER